MIRFEYIDQNCPVIKNLKIISKNYFKKEREKRCARDTIQLRKTKLLSGIDEISRRKQRIQKLTVIFSIIETFQIDLIIIIIEDGDVGS